jgi:hypothetical protein
MHIYRYAESYNVMGRDVNMMKQDPYPSEWSYEVLSILQTFIIIKDTHNKFSHQNSLFHYNLRARSIHIDRAWVR